MASAATPREPKSSPSSGPPTSRSTADHRSIFAPDRTFADIISYPPLMTMVSQLCLLGPPRGPSCRLRTPSRLPGAYPTGRQARRCHPGGSSRSPTGSPARSEEHTSELQSRQYLVCRLLLEKKTRHRHNHQPKRSKIEMTYFQKLTHSKYADRKRTHLHSNAYTK